MNIETLLGISEQDFVQLIINNPALASVCKGYSSEYISKQFLLKIPEVLEVTKMSDHDRNARYDFLVKTAQRDIRVEVKMLSDKAERIKVQKGDKGIAEVDNFTIRTHLVPRHWYDVLCIVTSSGCLFIKTEDIPSATRQDIPEEHRCKFLQGYLPRSFIEEKGRSEFPLI
jgi:hypothetical protein